MKGDRNLKLQRKLLGILLTICLLAGVMGGMAETAFAADPATLTVSSGSCEVGGTVKVTVKVSAPEAIGVVEFTLTYDTSLLESVIDTPFSLIRTILILSLNFSLSN